MKLLSIFPIIETKLNIWLEYNTEDIPKILIPRDLFPEENISGWITIAYGHVFASRYDGEDILIVSS